MESRGFTLVETVIVIATLSIVVAFSLFMGLGDYLGSSFHGEANTVVTALQTARANALNNIDQAPHGLALYPSDYPAGYVLFEGPSYASRTVSADQMIPAATVIGVDPSSPKEVVFQQLSGATGTDISLVLVDPRRGVTSTISINNEGGISW